MFKDFMGKWKQRRDGRRIERGEVPRGRSDFGGAVVKGQTRLLVQHFRNGEEVKESQREIFNRVITNAGRDAIVDAFTNTFALETFNHHDCGTGTVAEAVGDTALGTAVTEAREAGAQTQPTSNTYRSVATVTFAAAYAITEHGLFSQAAKPGGTLLDRTVFAAINVASADAIQFTFEISFASGG